MIASVDPVIVRRKFNYAPPPWRVFDALVNELDKWWCHRVAPRAGLSLEAREGGRFLQTAGQHVVDYARVAQLQRPRLLQFEGSFGMEAGHNVLTLLLEPKDGGTTLLLEHECRSSALRDPPSIRHAWGELFGECLRDWLDTEQSPLGEGVNPRFPLAP